MKIAVVSDNINMNTGYAKMAYNTLRILKEKGHDVYNIGIQHGGDVVSYNGIPIYSGKVYYAGQQQALDRSISIIKPEAVLFIRDMVSVNLNRITVGHTFAKYAGKFKRIIWTPVMTEIIPSDTVSAVNQSFDSVVSMTDYGMRLLIDNGVPYNQIYSIGAGFDPEIYRRREKYIEHDYTLFGAVALYTSQRKQLANLINAMHHYVETFDREAKLYIHTNVAGIPYDIKAIAAHFKISSNILLPMSSGTYVWIPEWDLTEEEMASLYSSFDLTVTTSGLEGFNMPFLESLACETPVLGTYTPFYDWSDQIQVVPSYPAYDSTVDLGYVSDPLVFAEMMHTAKDKKIDREKLMDLTWEKQVEKMEKVIEHV